MTQGVSRLLDPCSNIYKTPWHLDNEKKMSVVDRVKIIQSHTTTFKRLRYKQWSMLPQTKLKNAWWSIYLK